MKHRRAGQATRHVQAGGKWSNDFHGLCGEVGVCAMLGDDAFDHWRCENHTGADDGVDLEWRASPADDRTRIEVKWTATKPPRLMFRLRSHFQKPDGEGADVAILTCSGYRPTMVIVVGFIEISEFIEKARQQENGTWFVDGGELASMHPFESGIYVPQRVRATW